MAGMLYQRQHNFNQPVSIGGVSRNYTKYKCNYHSCKVKLAAMNFGFEKYKCLLLQGLFLVLILITPLWSTGKS